MRDCFNSLDNDGGGSIGIEELEEPLVGLGFAQDKEEVVKMISKVDDDGSGNIEFPEFLAIMNGAAEEGVNVFFKEMANGKIGNKNLSFNVNVQNIRRKYMVDAIHTLTKDPETKSQYLNKCNQIFNNVGL